MSRGQKSRMLAYPKAAQEEGVSAVAVGCECPVRVALRRRA
jgi:hypothetical protein